MNKRSYFSLVLILSLILGLITGCSYFKRDAIRLGAGNIGGMYHNYANNLSDSLSSINNHTLNVIDTAGSAANLRLLAEGYLDMAMVQSDILMNYVNSSHGDFHTVATLYDEPCQIIVRSNLHLSDLSELKGLKVSVGPEESGVLKNATDILNAYDIKFSDLEVSYLSYEEAADALRDGLIDAFFCTSGLPTIAVAPLIEEGRATLLSIDEYHLNKLTLLNPEYKIVTIEDTVYNNQTLSFRTIAVSAVLIARNNINPDFEADVLTTVEKYGATLMNIDFDEPTEESHSSIYKLSINMYLTLAIAVFVLYMGSFLRSKIRFLETFCIPAPVIGGLIFALLSFILYSANIVEFQFDETLKNICIIMFFTSVGYQANIKILKNGGVKLIIFLVTVIALIFSQNLIALGISKLLDISPLIALCTGSIPMVGGHGTSGAFGQVLEDLGLNGATTLCTASATFGLVAGSLMGGPIGRRRIIKQDLLKTVINEDPSVLVEEEKKHIRKVSMYAPAAYQLAIAMGIGTIVSDLLSMTGMTFPAYIGAMIVAAIIRNIAEFTEKYTVHMGEINDIGGICLSIFLGIAMITLKLWQLAALALPLVVLLSAQAVFMAFYSYFVVFNVMGRNYDAAVLSAGTCGFGMGATPNAMANMQAITEKYAPSVEAYILVPIVGSMFADFINSIVITLFINIV